MELIENQEFIENWLTNPNFDESKVSDLLVNQLKYFTNRRQVDKFHSWLFDCSTKFDLTSSVNWLPKQFQLLYGQTIIKSPPLQTIQTWKLFLKEDILNLPVVMELFVCFLDHIKVCDDLVPKVILPQEAQCISETKNLLLDCPLHELKRPCQFTLVLRLFHACGNLTLLKYFYDKEKPISDWSKYSWYDLGVVHKYFSGDVWKTVVNEGLSSDQLQLRETTFKLLIQKLSILTKAIYTESDPRDQEICTNNVHKTVEHILSKIFKHRHLIDSLDLWRFASFVADDQLHRFTQLIVEGTVESLDGVCSQLPSIMSKGCENSTFVLSMVESIIQKFKETLTDEPDLVELYACLELNFFEETPERLNIESIVRLKEPIGAILHKDPTILKSPSCFRSLTILTHVPLEHLQEEANLKCSTFLISLIFSMEFTSDDGKQIVDILLPILNSDQCLWFLKAYTPSKLCKALFKRVKKASSIPDHVGSLITAVIEKLFKDLTQSEVIPIIEASKLTQARSESTRRCLTTLLLKKLTGIGRSSTNLATDHIKCLLEMFNDKQIMKTFSLKETNDSLLAIIEYFAKRKSLNDEERKLCKSFTSICSKIINRTCKSLINPENVDAIDFKSNVRLLLLLCETSKKPFELLSPSQFDLIWLSLFPNYPELDQTGNEFMVSLDNRDEYLHAIPIISKCVFLNISGPTLVEYVNYCLKALGEQTTEIRKLLVLHVLKGLINKEWTKSSAKDSEMYKYIDSILDKFLLSIATTVKTQRDCEEINVPTVQACCDLVKDILHTGKDLLTSPRLYYCLQICAFLPIQQLTSKPDQYSKVLSSYYSILNRFLLNYNYMVITSIILLKDLIKNYMETLTQASDQKEFINYDKENQKGLINGASDLNKLISQLTNDFADDFAPYSPHLITCYISLNHSYTIHPLVKQHLTLCMYRLLNVIKSNINWKDTYDMIHCRLDESGRDLLKILYENYEKFYVFKGRF